MTDKKRRRENYGKIRARNTNYSLKQKEQKEVKQISNRCEDAAKIDGKTIRKPLLIRTIHARL